MKVVRAVSSMFQNMRQNMLGASMAEIPDEEVVGNKNSWRASRRMGRLMVTENDVSITQMDRACQCA